MAGAALPVRVGKAIPRSPRLEHVLVAILHGNSHMCYDSSTCRANTRTDSPKENPDKKHQPRDRRTALQRGADPRSVAMTCQSMTIRKGKAGPHRLDLVVAGDAGHRAVADERLHEVAPEVPAGLVGGGRAAAGHARAGDVGRSERGRRLVICGRTLQGHDSKK